MGGEEFVTGEAVPLDLRIAQLPSRSMAIAIDLAVQLTLVVIGIWLIIGVSLFHANSATIAGLVIVLLALIFVGYPVAFETFTRGRSLGKLALGLRVVRDDGGAERFRHALVRGLFGVVEIWMLSGVPAVLVSLFNSRGKRLGDLAAGTVVVRERTPRARPMPERWVGPWVENWVGTADISRVPDDLALAIRQFLGRADTLRVEARGQLAYQLTSDLMRYVAPPPPQGSPPEAVLTAVLVERRRREELRLRPQPTGGYSAPPMTSRPPQNPSPPESSGFQLPG
jgi:uncharacterized RDD family membrane protein YckC